MKHRSIRTRLLLWLLPLLVLILGAFSIFDYLRAIRPMEAAYDAALENTAFAVSARLRADQGMVRLDLSEQTVALLRTDLIDRIFFRVIGPSGRTLAGDLELKGPASTSGITFFDDVFQNQAVRGVSYPVATPFGIGTVLVAETTVKRVTARRAMITNRIAQDIVFVFFAVLVVWFAVRGVLRPLEQLAAHVSARSPSDLRALPENGSPREVLPLIDSLNRLFVRIGSTQDGQRRFIENAAHQLRTPLAGLQGQVELAIKEARRLGETGSALDERLTRIEQATRRVTHLANQLLTLSRSDRPTHDSVARRAVQLADLVNDVVAIQIDRAIEREQDLGAEAEPVAVLAIEWELREVISNLVDNAIRYTPRGGRITVRCGPLERGAFIEVEDSGVGIAPEERDRVFERFYRAAGAVPGGSGLGLSIVHEIASLYEARVQISDPPRGQGAVVRIVFPLAYGQQA